MSESERSVTAAAPADAGHERDWVGPSARSVAGEAALYLRTMRSFVFQPRAFVHDWMHGSGEMMNPIGFLALSVLVLGTVRSFGWNYLVDSGSAFAAQVAGQKPFWAELWAALGPSLHFAALGLIAHYTLRLTGNRGARASSSAAMTFYSAGSMGMLAEVAVWIVVLALLAGDVVPLERIYTPLFAGFGLALGAFCAYLGFSLGALHRPRWWHMFLAFAAAFILTGLFFGYVDPPGEYGIRWFIRFGTGLFPLQLRL